MKTQILSILSVQLILRQFAGDEKRAMQYEETPIYAGDV